MNKFLTLPTISQTYSVIATLMMIALCSCKTTTTSGPSLSPSLSKSSQIANDDSSKRSRKRFSQKPGDPVADFEKDNRGGRLKLKQYGAPGSLTPYYNKLLTEELGVKIQVIGDGVISGEMLRYAKHYNALMTREIQRKYGPDILLEARRRAQIMQAQARSNPSPR